MTVSCDLRHTRSEPFILRPKKSRNQEKPGTNEQTKTWYTFVGMEQGRRGTGPHRVLPFPKRGKPLYWATSQTYENFCGNSRKCDGWWAWCGSPEVDDPLTGDCHQQTQKKRRRLHRSTQGRLLTPLTTERPLHLEELRHRNTLSDTPRSDLGHQIVTMAGRESCCLAYFSPYACSELLHFEAAAARGHDAFRKPRSDVESTDTERATEWWLASDWFHERKVFSNW